jgi:glycosyltransferase involved in cell wall biosynthesis
MANLPTVVIVSEVMPMGGTSNFALNLCSGMRESGNWNGVVAVMRSPAAIMDEARRMDLPLIDRDDSLILHEERIEKLYRECARYSPQAVVAALSSGSFDFLRYAPQGCLRVAMIQSDDEGVYSTVLQYLPWIDLVVGVSKEICRKMEGLLDQKSPIPVIHQPYGVPMHFKHTAANCEAPLRVLYLGRINETQKRVSLMSRIIRTTLASGANLTWTIAGDGPDMESFRKSLEGITDRVDILGGLPYHEIPGILSKHDVYFLCSDFEGLPLSLLEAMGAGLVPVVSDLPSGISEVVSADNGIRIAVDDEQGYVDAILRLANNRDLLASLTSAAPNAVRDSHSISAMTRRWEEMLAQYGPATPPAWQPACKATVPMEVAHKWHLKPWLRPLRALIKRLKS